MILNVNSIPAFALSLIAAASLSACGQTGPLYKPKTTASPPVAQPAPAPAIPSTIPDQPATVPASK